MKRSELIKLHIIKRLPTVIGLVLLFAVFGLYYFGFYDISFIDRPDSWKNNYNLFLGLFDKDKTPEVPVTPDNVAEDDTQKDTENTEKPSKPTKPNKGDTKPNASETITFLSVSDLKKDGYYLTDKVYDSSCKIGTLDTAYKLPKKYTYGNKTVDAEEFYPSSEIEGAEMLRREIKKDTVRPALDTYMGYIIYDDIGKLYIIGPDGGVITTYDDTAYIPAYTRDRAGRPLFYRETTEYIEYPTETESAYDENDPDKKNWIKTDYLTEKVKHYYYLSENGYFVESNYNDATDNRGLYFDYPAYYGLPDGYYKRYYFNTTKIVTTKDKKTTSLVNDVRWMYSDSLLDINLFKFDRDGTNISDVGYDYYGEEGKNTFEEMFPYTAAYSFTGGYATVMCDVKWDYYHDEDDGNGGTVQKHYDVVSNELRIINTDGDIQFDSRKNFMFSMGGNTAWTANERFVLPLSRSIDSLGAYYFDHGLTRVRVQTYDRFYFTDLDLMHINTDDSVLMRANGERFPIPSGYELVSYSDGVLLLKKDGFYRYMDYTGAWLTDEKYYDALPFIEGVASCKNREGKYGMIDTNGKSIIPFKYDHLSSMSSGTAVAYSELNGWTVFQKMTVR